MTVRAQAALLPDARRLHLQDGPIDLIIEAFGNRDEVHAAYSAAVRRFATVLDELCSELPALRQPVRSGSLRPSGTISKRMFEAVLPYASEHFITPMAAVAGAVAEQILRAMTSAAKISRAYVNNGGDIAIHISEGESFSVGMAQRPDRPSLFGTVALKAADPVRGIATSGWRGRSFSLGIADAVTVLAENAAQADAAATIIANAVNLPNHPGVMRVAAHELAPDSDLGDLLVTQQVPLLTENEIEEALQSGLEKTASLLSRDLICAAALCLQGETHSLGILPGMLNVETPERLAHA